MQFCDYDFPLFGYVKIPKFHSLDSEKMELGLALDCTSNDYLAALAKRGINKKIAAGKIDKKDSAKYYERLEFEVNEICRLFFADYILLVYNTINFCRRNGILNGAGRGCLHGDSLVKTPNGYLKLKDVKIGDKVMTSNSTYESVINRFEYDIQEDLIEIVTSGSSHHTDIMTSDHKVLVLRDPFLNLRNSKGEILGFQKLEKSNYFKFENCEWIKAIDIKKGDYVVRTNDSYDCGIDLPRIDLSKYSDKYDEFYVYEESCINKNSSNSLCRRTVAKKSGASRESVKKAINGEWLKPKTLEKITSYLSLHGKTIDDLKLNPTKNTYKRNRYIEVDEDFNYLVGFFIGDGWFISDVKRNACGFAFNSEEDKEYIEKIKRILLKYSFSFTEQKSKTKKLLQLIINSSIFKKMMIDLFGGVKKAHDKIIPEILLAQNSCNLKSLHLGLIDSDGSRKGVSKTSFDSISEKLVLQSRDLTEGLTNSFCNIHKRIYTEESNCSDSFKLNISCGSETNGNGYNDGKYTFLKVKDKNTISGINKVYDITVEKYHNYQTANYIVHNSAAGSLLLYCLECTGVDPIKHHLLFERFISSARTSIKEYNGETYIESGGLPDVDIDSDCAKKDRINTFIEECFPGQTAAISTFGTFQGKVVLKEVLKVVENATEEQAKVAADLLEVKFGNVETIQSALKENPAFAEFAKSHKRTIEVASKLCGLIKNRSTHASGILICDKKLNDLIPVELSPDKELVTSFDMNDAQMFGVKLDNLGLKNLTAIDDCLSKIGIKFDDIDVNDKSIYEFLNNSNDYYGIFQAEKGLGKRVMKKLKCQNVSDLSISLALGRPGCMKFIEDLTKGRETGELRKIDDRLNPVLSTTCNVIIYQEQIMALCGLMAKFTALETNQVRKIIGKKLRDKMPLWKDKFINGSIANGFSKETAEDVWQSFEASGDYAFNKCLHSSSVVDLFVGGKYIPTVISNVKVGDYIRSFDLSEKKDIVSKVLNVYQNTNIQMVKVKWKSMNFPCYIGNKLPDKFRKTTITSLDHKFLCLDGEQRKLKEVIDGNIVLFGSYRIDEVEDFGLHNSYDLEVDHPDHNFYANGIVVSNSHSDAYAHLTAVTAWLKANHPVPFFTALLKNAKNEQDPIGEINTIAAELPRFGILFRGPHIIKSELDFSYEGNNIFFGLSHVKGVAEKTIEKLNSFRKNFSNKFEIFKGASDSGLNVGVLCNLIMVGALDDFLNQSRAKTCLEAQIWTQLTEKEQILCLKYGHEYNYNLGNTVKSLINDKKNEKGKPLITESRANTIRKKIATYVELFNKNKQNEKLTNYWFESRLLGFSYSSSLKEAFEAMNTPELTTISHLKDLPAREQAMFVGEVIHATQGLTKAKQVPYYKVVVRDHTDEITCFLYETERNSGISDHRELNGKMAEEGDIVVIRGQTSNGDCFNAANIAIQKIEVYSKISEIKKHEEKSTNI